MNRDDLRPDQVVLDLVLRWSDKIGRLGTAKVNGNALIVTAENHLREYEMATVEVNFEGRPVEGSAPRFVLYRLGPGVWKLAPSVLHARLHAYVTVIDVPEPAPWQMERKNEKEQEAAAATSGD